MAEPELILASTSEARRALMDGLGVRYRAVAPGVDESVAPGTKTRDAVRQLARRKAEAVRAKHPQAIVIGSDQLVEAAGEVLRKPLDRADAKRQLSSLLGKTHVLYTGVCVLGPGFDACEVDEARVGFSAVGEDELERYLDLEEWRGCAGGYRIEGRGAALVETLEGDRTGVQGLPMIRLVRLLRAAGARLL